ncbi:hypothetical protein M9Y10_023612 [Tritrichomonas musculus]|uniref:Uncharacterized protein n=1 Tax=Tritrichomonas musculus TaxID=1915356 RepID=A0ABR2KVQ4_9EUKA
MSPSVDIQSITTKLVRNFHVGWFLNSALVSSSWNFFSCLSVKISTSTFPPCLTKASLVNLRIAISTSNFRRLLIICAERTPTIDSPLFAVDHSGGKLNKYLLN